MSKITKPTIYVGLGTCGIASGGNKVYKALEDEVKAKGYDVELKKTSCVGMCHKEVLVDIVLPGKTRVTYGAVEPKSVSKLLEDHLGKTTIHKRLAVGQYRPADGEAPFEGLKFYDELPYFSKQRKVVLKNCGVIDPESIDEYIENGGYEAIKKIFGKKMSQVDVIDIVKKSGIRGRGGGGFPTGTKWEFCYANHADQKYMVCNADEGDPGAFMDRAAMEGDPHALLEGMIIAGYAIGATKGYIYCRAEYPLAIARAELAIKQATERGLMGKNILNSGFDFEIIVKEGAGAFVCGEETALLASIEGYRGMPRPKPPFPAVKGLWGKPTTINNVETLCNIPQIIVKGAEWFAEVGTEKSKGTKTLALSGKVRNTGLVEIPCGISVKELIFDIGGGIKKNRGFKAAQFGGPSGGCIPAAIAENIGIDYEQLTAAGAMMGSGGVVVMDDSSCMVDTSKFFMQFTQNESCGKCVPCRVGTKSMLEVLERITNGEGREGDIENMLDIGASIKASSLCGLGQTAPNPILSTIQYFRHEYEAHIKDKKCPATACVPLIEFVVQNEKCTSCGGCAKACPVEGCIDWEKGSVAFINHDKCISCKSCVEACGPFEAIK